jgi:hypothetical protein
MNYQDFTDHPDDESFLKRYRIAIIVGLVLVLIIGTIGILVQKFGKIPPPRKPQEIVVHLQPLPPMPPPPPPPPPPPRPPEQKFVEQPKDLKPMVKKDEAKNPDKPPGPPTPAASGPPSDFGIGGSGSSGDGIGESGGSEYGPYAAEVIAAIKARLQANSKTNRVTVHGLKTRIWADKTGRVIKATVSGSTGDPAVDEALKNEVLVGLQLQEPPPVDMPMPIVLRVSEQRAN